MTNDQLKTKIALFVGRRGLAFDRNVRWNIDAYGRDVLRAIDEMETAGVLARTRGNELYLARDFGPASVGPSMIDSQRKVLEACEGTDQDEFRLGRSVSRESIEDCLGERVKWLRVIRSKGGNRLRITPRGRAALFRHRRKERKGRNAS